MNKDSLRKKSRERKDLNSAGPEYPNQSKKPSLYLMKKNARRAVQEQQLTLNHDLTRVTPFELNKIWWEERKAPSNSPFLNQVRQRHSGAKGDKNGKGVIGSRGGDVKKDQNHEKKKLGL